MTDKDYSLDALNKFFDYAVTKGLIKQNTAQSRKIAVNKILAVLDDQEKGDLRKVNIDQVFERFKNLEKMKYKPDSMLVYLSRMRTAISDFLSYVDDPSSFKPGGTQRASLKARPATVKGSARKIEQGEKHEHQDHHVVVPVPLREGLVVKISNLPSDLTVAEAGRLAAIIKAYAVIGEE